MYIKKGILEEVRKDFEAIETAKALGLRIQ